MNENQPEQQEVAESTTESKQQRVVSGADLSNWSKLTQRQKEVAATNFHQALMRALSED